MNYDRMTTLREKLGDLDAGMVLDVAVGKGDFLLFLLEAVKSWKGAAGIDISSESLAVACNALARFPVTLVTGSALSMPFPDRMFDTVTISNSLHHMEDVRIMLDEAGRVCKTDGLVVVNEMVRDRVTSMRENHMLYHNLIAEIDNQMGHYHRMIYGRDELSAIIRESDMQIVEHFCHDEEEADGHAREEDIGQLVDSLNRRLEMLRNTEHYYFYENKAGEIISRLKDQGFHKPSHMTYFLKARTRDRAPSGV